MDTSRLAMSGHAALLALGLAWFAPAAPLLASTPIYKCFDVNLGLLYTDEPCKDGERLNIRAGDADPAAVARLERARDALDQSAAQRITEMQRVAEMQRIQNATHLYAFQETQGAYDDQSYNLNAYDYPPYGYGGLWWLPRAAHAHMPRNRGPKALDHRRGAPAPSPRAMPWH
jgi:hypothetical protein